MSIKSNGSSIIGLTIFSIFFAATKLISPAFADPVQPFPSREINGYPLLGGWVEQAMQQMVRDCTQTPGNANLRIQHTNGLHFTSDWGEVSAIPTQIVSDLKLNSADSSTVFINSDESITREFGYVYTKSQQDTDQKEPDRYLGLEYNVDKDQAISPGISGFQYNATCSNALNASLDASGGYSFPIATVKASLSADYEGSTSYSISLVKGQFASPILAMYKGTNGDGLSTSGEEFFAALVFWDWYASHPDQVGERNSVLSDFDGLSLYKSASAKEKTKLAANVSAGISAAVATASAATDLGHTTASQFTGNSYESAAVVKAGKPVRHFADIPALRDVITQASLRGRFRLDTKLSDDAYLYDATSQKKFVQNISFLPSKFCDAGLWSVDSSAINISDAKPFAASGVVGGCSFYVTYTPPKDAQLVDTTLAYNFALSFVDGKGTAQSLKLSSDPISLIARTTPRLEYLSGLDTPSITKQSNSSASLTWNLLFKLVDDGAITNTAQIDFRSVDFENSCGQTAVANVQPGLLDNSVPAAAAKTLQIVVYNSYGRVLGDMTKTDAYVPCKLQGKATFTITDNTGAQRQVIRSFPDTVLQFPNKDAK